MNGVLTLLSAKFLMKLKISQFAYYTLIWFTLRLNFCRMKPYWYYCYNSNGKERVYNLSAVEGYLFSSTYQKISVMPLFKIVQGVKLIK